MQATTKLAEFIARPSGPELRSREAEAAAEFVEAAGERLRETHTAERFARAMELLSADVLEIRLGGIYSLERLAKDSHFDQSAVAEVLATHVRRNAQWSPKKEPPERLASEIQVILTVLGRRHFSIDREDKPLDLHGTAFPRAHLPFANFQKAFLYNCYLGGALLYEANLTGAWLARSNLTLANLDGADLRGADLTDAVGVTYEQLQDAKVDEETKLPRGIV